MGDFPDEQDRDAGAGKILRFKWEQYIPIPLEGAGFFCARFPLSNDRKRPNIY